MATSVITRDQQLTKDAIKYLRRVYNYENFTSDLQKQVVLRILKRESYVNISLPDGYGGKLCYELPALMAAVRDKKWTIVLTTMSLSTEIHIRKLRNLGIKCSTFGQIYSSDPKNIVQYFEKLYENLCSRFMNINLINELPGLLYVPVKLANLSPIISLLIHTFDTLDILSYIVVDEVIDKFKSKNLYRSLGKLKKKFPRIPWISVTNQLSFDEKLSCNGVTPTYDECLVSFEKEKLTKKINEIWNDLVIFYESSKEREKKIQKD